MDKKLVEENKKSKVGTICVCPICGSEFEKKQWQQSFCSSKCKDEWWNRMKPERHKRGKDYYKQYYKNGLGNYKTSESIRTNTIDFN